MYYNWSPKFGVGWGKEIMAEKVFIFNKNYNPQTQEVQQIPGRKNKKPTTPKHNIIKLLKANDKQDKTKQNKKTLQNLNSAGGTQRYVTYRGTKTRMITKTSHRF